MFFAKKVCLRIPTKYGFVKSLTQRSFMTQNKFKATQNVHRMQFQLCACK